jgi:hypothetical protein
MENKVEKKIELENVEEYFEDEKKNSKIWSGKKNINHRTNANEKKKFVQRINHGIYK